MKKAVCLLFTISLLVLCACGAPPAEPSEETTGETSDESSIPAANPVSDFRYEETDDGGIVQRCPKGFQ